MFDPWKKSPSSTLYTQKKKPIAPLSFWLGRHCSYSERLEKEEPWWLADRFAAQNCSRVHGQTLLYFKFSNVKMTTHVRVDFVVGFFIYLFYFIFLSLCDHTTVFLNESGSTVQTARQQRVNKALERTCGSHNPAWSPPPPRPPSPACFFTVSEITSPVTFTGIVEIQAGWYVNWLSDGAEAKKWPCFYICASPGSKWWNISSLP